MISRLLYLLALILFVALAAFHPTQDHLAEWALAAIAAGLMLEGYGWAAPTLRRRQRQD
jgi:hypothetical protein